MSEWISVKDRFPKDQWEQCIVAFYYVDEGPPADNVTAVCEFHDNKWFFPSVEEEDAGCLVPFPEYIVTHWMPLPEPPNE